MALGRNVRCAGRAAARASARFVGHSCAVATIAALAILVLPGSIDAATPRWSEAIRVSDNVPAKVDWFPAVAADNGGNVHVVWNLTSYDDSKGHDATDPETIGQLEYSRWNGQSWTPQVDIGLIWYGYALRNALTLDAAGRLQLTYKGWGTPERPTAGRSIQDIWFKSADGARADAIYAWTQPSPISSGLPGYFSDVATDTNGVIHVIWTEGDSTGKYGLYYSRSSDGGRTWSQRATLSGDESVWWYRAHLKIDDQNRLHVVWEVLSNDGNSQAADGFGVTRMAEYAQSIDGGTTWTKHDFTGTVSVLNGDKATPGPQQPVVDADGNGTLLLVYRDASTDRIVYRQSADGLRWSEPLPIPGVKTGVARPYDIYDFARDSAGHLHLVMVGYATGSSDMAVLHAEWNGQSWTSADTIATAPPFPEYPRIAVGEGNRLHVVWFGGDNASTNRTPVGIWYSTATASAPSTRGQIRISHPAAPLSGSAPASSLVPPTPPPPPVPVPTPVTLAPADRTADGLRSAGPSGLLQEPGTPGAVAVILVCLVLAAVMFLRRPHADTIDGRPRPND